MDWKTYTCKCHKAVSSNWISKASWEWQTDIFGVLTPTFLSNTIMLHLWRHLKLINHLKVVKFYKIYLSNILVLAFSYRSNSCGKWASSSHELPHPRTLAKSFPVPSGKTPTWHLFCNANKLKRNKNHTDQHIKDNQIHIFYMSDPIKYMVERECFQGKCDKIKIYLDIENISIDSN